MPDPLGPEAAAYTLAADNYLITAEVNAKGRTFEVSGVTKLFAPMLSWENAASYDVSADGQRFLVPMPPEGSRPSRGRWCKNGRRG